MLFSAFCVRVATTVTAFPLLAVAQGYGNGDTAPSPSSLPATATIDIGTIVGTTTSLPTSTAPVNKFLGIPFAQSPPERFTAPAPPAPLNGILQTQQWKPACIQQFVGLPAIQNFTEGVFNEPPPQESEDCLYLNVYAPSSPAPSDGRAVLFWIYGGGLQFGDAGNFPYDGSAFAAYQDVILVSPNYRTNVFGFPNSAELPVTGQNLGYLDQRAALDWVQKNIDKFGGDPEKVTIFGESAGGLSVDTLLTSYTTDKAPFRGAILESGQASYGRLLGGVNNQVFSQLAGLLNCDGTSNLTCVRAAPATTIKQLISDNSLIFSPIVDNVTNVAQPALARAAGTFAKVPVLGGTNFQEGRIFQVGQSDLTAFLQTTFGTVSPQQIPLIEAAYGPVGTTAGINTDYDIISAIYTDLNFQCPQALQANETAMQNVPTWRYLYNASFPNQEVFPGAGVYHSTEIVQVFQTYAGGPINPNTPGPEDLQPTQIPPTAQQVALSEYMNSVWAAFAKNPLGGPGWTPLGKFDESLGVLGVNGSSGVTVINPNVVSSRCSLFYPAYKAAAGGVVLPGLGG